jgi:hypothetical protein
MRIEQEKGNVTSALIHPEIFRSSTLLERSACRPILKIQSQLTACSARKVRRSASYFQAFVAFF